MERDETSKKTAITKVKSIRLIKDEITYTFPAEYQLPEHHVELFKLSTIAKACKSMNKKGQFRNIVVSLSEGLVPLYFDEEGNAVFKDLYLEEENHSTDTSSQPSSSQQELQALLQTLVIEREKREIDLSQINKLFVLDTFTGKQNAIEWMGNFERECNRNKVRLEA
ncbi:hypothetical protein KPH14_011922 [Odynerus spinipes]|uniref:Uncharacterized protein n=1 Tax=Odynerus spinipes TaxID=1348599 RepID=A0AAD9VLK5_9HYME|nr:hypothetical protein KPH14_011922 [Odynerus spinipes]